MCFIRKSGSFVYLAMGSNYHFSAMIHYAFQRPPSDRRSYSFRNHCIRWHCILFILIILGLTTFNSLAQVLLTVRGCGYSQSCQRFFVIANEHQRASEILTNTLASVGRALKSRLCLGFLWPGRRRLLPCSSRCLQSGRG